MKSAALFASLILALAIPLQGQVNFDSERAEELLKKVSDSVGEVSETFDALNSNLTRSENPNAGYPKRVALGLLVQARDATLERLEAPELEPLRDWAGPMFARNINHLSSGPNSEPVTRDAWSQAASGVSEVLSYIKSLDSLVVDLHTVSEPSESRVTLWIRNHSEPERETWTHDTIKNVYRGRYLSRAEKEGWKPAELEINLLTESGTLECRLVPETDDRQSNCRLNNE